MPRAWTPILALLAAQLLPAQVDTKIWNLIDPADHAVFGIDLDRYRHSALNPTDDHLAALAASARYMILIAGGSTEDPPLRILLGYAPKQNAEADAPSLFMLDANTAIAGSAEPVRRSVRLWSQDVKGNALADDARARAESDDAWFVLLKPLSLPALPQGATPPKHLAGIVDVIEQISGGVRFGASDQVHLDVRARSAEDAYSLAALGKWLPGLIQAMNPEGRESRLLDLTQNFTVMATGRTVALSFTVPEDKLAALLLPDGTDIRQ